MGHPNDRHYIQYLVAFSGKTIFPLASTTTIT